MSKRLAAFDFDNTLVVSDSKAKVTYANGQIEYLNSHEYAKYKKAPGDVIDYSDFDKIVNPKLMTRYVKILRAAMRAPNTDVIIVTARGNEKPIAEYLKTLGITAGLKIKALDSSSPNAKKKYIGNRAKKYNYSDVYFFDDSPDNQKAIESLRDDPRVSAMIHTHLVPPERYEKYKPSNVNKANAALKQKIKNPVTGHNILVASALKYPKDHPAAKEARKLVKQAIKS
jgi:hypothetical protein